MPDHCQCSHPNPTSLGLCGNCSEANRPAAPAPPTIQDALAAYTQEMQAERQRQQRRMERLTGFGSRRGQVEPFAQVDAAYLQLRHLPDAGIEWIPEEGETPTPIRPPTRGAINPVPFPDQLIVPPSVGRTAQRLMQVQEAIRDQIIHGTRIGRIVESTPRDPNVPNPFLALMPRDESWMVDPGAFGGGPQINPVPMTQWYLNPQQQQQMQFYERPHQPERDTDTVDAMAMAWAYAMGRGGSRGLFGTAGVEGPLTRLTQEQRDRLTSEQVDALSRAYGAGMNLEDVRAMALSMLAEEDQPQEEVVPMTPEELRESELTRLKLFFLQKRGITQEEALAKAEKVLAKREALSKQANERGRAEREAVSNALDEGPTLPSTASEVSARMINRSRRRSGRLQEVMSTDDIPELGTGADLNTSAPEPGVLPQGLIDALGSRSHQFHPVPGNPHRFRCTQADARAAIDAGRGAGVRVTVIRTSVDDTVTIEVSTRTEILRDSFIEAMSEGMHNVTLNRRTRRTGTNDEELPF